MSIASAPLEAREERFTRTAGLGYTFSTGRAVAEIVQYVIDADVSILSCR